MKMIKIFVEFLVFDKNRRRYTGFSSKIGCGTLPVLESPLLSTPVLLLLLSGFLLERGTCLLPSTQLEPSARPLVKGGVWVRTLKYF